jgi:hypothetical protein
VGGNQHHGRLALLKSRTVGSSHELNVKHDDDDEGSASAAATATVIAHHPSFALHHQQQQQQQHAPSPPPPLRSKVKTNGHLIPYMQQKQQQVTFIIQSSHVFSLLFLSSFLFNFTFKY